VTLIRWARTEPIPITVRGYGSSMGGGAIGPGVVLDVSRLDAIGEIDTENRRIKVGPGAIRESVNAAALEKGLRFPVDPSSGKFCTIGGMVATNAAGARTLRFGSTRRWVTSLDCVLADGSQVTVTRGQPTPGNLPAVARFHMAARPQIQRASTKIGSTHKKVRKESSGYALKAYLQSDDLIDILIGSEGTLAVITGIELSLADVAPATSGVLGAFASLDDAVNAAGRARMMGAVACELLDKTFLDVARGGNSGSLEALPAATEAALIAEVEAQGEEAARTLGDKLANEFRSARATYVSVALSHVDQNEIWELRHAASPILARLDQNLRSMQFVEDGAVPPDKLAHYVKGVRAALNSHGVKGVIFGHAGDGHVHVNPLIDMSKANWRDKVDSLLEDIVTLTRKLSGTLSGEHGDGRLRAPLLSEVWPEDEVRLFRLIKSAFDPDGILNPGVKLSLTGQRPIEDVKYDPTITPLPAEAKRALDIVADDRAYAKFRLSLLDQRE
ncbi:MAG TPA: FAD-binding oxidoreductase, partial [Gemmatimonadaceae bacterium]|nr:FAD-binding oxidoreductase [Gemmatimonadaceae bacterium]